MIKISIFIILISYIYYSFFTSIETIHSSIYKSITKIIHIKGIEYDFNLLKIASNNFRYPILIKDLLNITNFNNLSKWNQKDYVIDKLRNISITIDDSILLNKYDNIKNDKLFEEIILINNIMKIYSNIDNHNNNNNNNNNSNDIINNLLQNDLINTMWHGFATSKHKTYLGGNIILNQGKLCN
jgi:hypothetical protein